MLWVLVVGNTMDMEVSRQLFFEDAHLVLTQLLQGP